MDEVRQDVGEGWRVAENGVFGNFVSPDMPTGCDTVLVCVNRYQHEPKTICMPHQLYVDKLIELMRDELVRSVTIMPYRNADKVTITREQLLSRPPHPTLPEQLPEAGITIGEEG